MIAGAIGDGSYCSRKDYGRNFYVWAEDQRWDEETRKELKEKYNIIFNGGVRPIMVVRRDGEGLDPLLIVGSEDDGTICFTRKYSTFDNAFDVGWTKSFIRNLKDAAEYAGVKIFEEEKMKAKVNGVEVEGTPEEIAKFLEVKYNHGPVIDYDDFLVKHEQKNKKPNNELDICKDCPHRGEGCNPQHCL